MSGSVSVEKSYVKNAIWPAAQNPFAATSNLASSDVFAALCSNCSRVSFCNVGSMRTSWHTSFSRLAVMFLSLLRWSVIKPSFLHVRACSMLKFFPHVHVDVRDNGYPYLILARSQNSCLLSMYPSPSIGKVDGHIEAPCSVLISFSRHCWLLSLDFISISFCWLHSCLSCLIFFLMLFMFLFEFRKSFLVVLLMIHTLLLAVKCFEIQCLLFREKQLYPFPQV